MLILFKAARASFFWSSLRVTVFGGFSRKVQLPYSAQYYRLYLQNRVVVFISVTFICCTKSLVLSPREKLIITNNKVKDSNRPLSFLSTKK